MLRTLSRYAICACLVGCHGEPSDLGNDALLRVEGGTFRRGAFPEPNGGPDVHAAFLGRMELRTGEQDKSFSGVLEPGAKAVAIALAGDVGFWTVPAGFPLPEAPDSPSFSAPLSFSSDVPLGPAELLSWAVDEEERYGEPRTVRFEFVRAPLPEGALVVALTWDTASDLDLHVVTPGGVEIDKDDRSSGSSSDAGGSPGSLDFDSNAGCEIDLRNNENVVWPSSPPSGRYVVRVDTVSLCEAVIARWRVQVVLGGEHLGAAEGTSTQAAVRQPHGHGAGVLALEFDVP